MFMFLLAGGAAVLEVHRLIHRRGHVDGDDELEQLRQREHRLKQALQVPTLAYGVYPMVLES